jgi:hypothetical protein
MTSCSQNNIGHVGLVMYHKYRNNTNFTCFGLVIHEDDMFIYTLLFDKYIPFYKDIYTEDETITKFE